MAEKSNRSFQFPFYFVAIFLTILVITVIIFSSLTLNMNQSAIAEQHQQPSFNEDASFDIGNVTFSHNMVSVNGIQLHYVTGGQGDPIVLLHGWPETWYEWRHIMPALAKNYTVIAPDLRGLGDSSKPLSGYDGNTTAEDIYQLLSKLGLNQKIYLVGHDVGVLTAYSYAASHPNNVSKLVILDVPPLPPPGFENCCWWFSFHQTPDT